MNCVGCSKPIHEKTYAALFSRQRALPFYVWFVGHYACAFNITGFLLWKERMVRGWLP